MSYVLLAGKLTDPQAPMSQFIRVRCIFLPLHACGENYKKNMILQYTLLVNTVAISLTPYLLPLQLR